jgi:hypothetical protein
MVQVLEHLLSKHYTLNPNQSTDKKEKKKENNNNFETYLWKF